MANQNFQSGNTNSNCHGFATFATSSSSTVETEKKEFNVTGMSQTTSPNTGDIAVFNMKGQYQYKGMANPVDANNIQAHSAIFVLNNQAGEAQYLNRINTGKSVSISTKSEIANFFANPNNAYAGPSSYIMLPKLNNNPNYFRRK